MKLLNTYTRYLGYIMNRVNDSTDQWNTSKKLAHPFWDSSTMTVASRENQIAECRIFNTITAIWLHERCISLFMHMDLAKEENEFYCKKEKVLTYDSRSWKIHFHSQSSRKCNHVAILIFKIINNMAPKSKSKIEFIS